RRPGADHALAGVQVARLRAGPAGDGRRAGDRHGRPARRGGARAARVHVPGHRPGPRRETARPRDRDLESRRERKQSTAEDAEGAERTEVLETEYIRVIELIAGVRRD